MLLKRALPTLVLGAMLSSTACAGEDAPPPPVEAVINPQVLLGGIVAEDDVTLLFTHMRAALRASAEGREPPLLPETLSKRLDAAGSEMQLRGYIAAIALSHSMESAVRDAVRELAPFPSDVR